MKLKKQLAGALTAGILVLGGPTAAMAYEAPVVPVVQQNNQGGQATFGNLIAALNNINVQIDRLNALNDLTVQDIRVVNVEDVLSGNNIIALNNALNNNQVEINILRQALNRNTVLTDFLNRNNIAVNDVVAIDVLSGGDVVVFVQNQ